MQRWYVLAGQFVMVFLVFWIKIKTKFEIEFDSIVAGGPEGNA